MIGLSQLKVLIIIIGFASSVSFCSSYAGELVEYTGIYSQNDKVGYSKTIFKEVDNKLIISNSTKLKISLFGSEDSMNVNSKYTIKDEKIEKFTFTLESKDLKVKSVGERNNNLFRITNSTVSGVSRFSISLDEEPVAASYVYRWIAKQGLEVGDVYNFKLFEPSVLLLGSDVNKQDAVVKVLGRETISIPSGDYNTFKLRVTYNGLDSTVWINKDGALVKDISSIGLTAIKENENLFSNFIRSKVNIIEKTAISSNYYISNPRSLSKLKIRVTGIDSLEDFDLMDEERQSIHDNVLNIQMEKVNYKDVGTIIYNGKPEYLEHTSLIQSGNPEIKRLAELITKDKTNPYVKIDSIKDWVYENLDKKPTLSIPNAMDILSTRKGDCNEHSVIFTALARASNIPTKIVLGLVYIDGKFYYHAWNEVFIDKWVTVDSTFNQFPADASHVQFLEGDIKRSSELIKLVGKLKIDILEAS